MTALARRFIEGRGTIAGFLSDMAGIDISVGQVYRYAERSVDPLPLKRVGRMDKPRVIADPAELKAWASREWPELIDLRIVKTSR